jgi:DNA-binding GntR family transcriptional regulator
MPISRTPLGDQVYHELTRLLELGELSPGSRVRDAVLAQRLGVSRTPVREALLRLSREGLLDSGAGRGFRVRPLDRGELREVGALLAELEPLALRLVPEPGPDRLARLDELIRQMEQSRSDAGRVIELDETWHQGLLEECPNRRLLDIIATLRRVPRRYLYAYLLTAGRLGLSTLHHTRVLAALRAGDRAKAAALLERRWRRGIEEMESWVP